LKRAVARVVQNHNLVVDNPTIGLMMLVSIPDGRRREIPAPKCHVASAIAWRHKENERVLQSVGLNELFAMLMLAVYSLLPMAVAIWALVKLHQIGNGLRAVEVRLGAIEQLLHKS
jgi:hypothetical protein